MAKQCPVCGTRFPNYANVCDQHGVELRRVWPRYLPVSIVATVLLLAAPFAAGAWWLRHLRVEVVTAQLENGNAAKSETSDVSRWLASKNLKIQVHVHNDSNIPVVMQSAQYELIVSSVKAGEGNWTASLGLPAEAVAVVPLADPAVRGVLLNGPSEGVHVHLRAWLTLRIAGFSWAAPVERRLLVKPLLAL